MSAPFSPDRFLSLVREAGTRLGQPLCYLPVTESTNDDALVAARGGAPEGATFVAEEQTRGRGRRGRTWLSSPGDSLTFSVLLRPKLVLRHGSVLTLAAGLAVHDALTPLVPTPLGIKWPNDILAGDEKLAGILVEAQAGATTFDAVIVGIGLNVHTEMFPEEVRARATSLHHLGARDLSREALLVAILGALGDRVDALTEHGVEALLPALRAHDALAGRRVSVEQRSGIARGIDELGRLLLETAPGRVEAIVSGTVEWVG